MVRHPKRRTVGGIYIHRLQLGEEENECRESGEQDDECGCSVGDSEGGVLAADEDDEGRGCNADARENEDIGSGGLAADEESHGDEDEECGEGEERAEV